MDLNTRRRTTQFGFLALTLVGVYVLKGNAERWCPFGGVEALHAYLTEGDLPCSLGISNFYILIGVLVITLLMRRAFCGYMCPIGTLSEWLGQGAIRCGLRPAQVSPHVDSVVALLKYVVLAILLFFTLRTGELVFRGYDPCYALIGRHGDDILVWAYVVAGVIVLGSLLVTMPFCRWLCPLGAVLNPFSRFGLGRINRNEATCIGCDECNKACPMAIPVADMKAVTQARCMSCMNCVDVCSRTKTDALTWGPPKRLGGKWSQSALIAVMLLCALTAVAAAWIAPLPSFVRTRGSESSQVSVTSFRVKGLTCRGRANLFTYFLQREDDLAVPSYHKIEAWPSPDIAHARVSYDPSVTNETAIKQAITEPYFQRFGTTWTSSPFEIIGFDTRAIDSGEASH